MQEVDQIGLLQVDDVETGYVVPVEKHRSSRGRPRAASRSEWSWRPSRLRRIDQDAQPRPTMPLNASIAT